MKRPILLMIYTIFCTTTIQAQTDWQLQLNIDVHQKTTALETPHHFALFQLKDYDKLFDKLAMASSRFDDVHHAVQIQLPMPDRTLRTFEFQQSPTMAPKLQRKYDDIRAYTGHGVEHEQLVVKIDFGRNGFHGLIRGGDNGSIFIDPYNVAEDLYMVYYKSDYPAPTEPFECHAEHDKDPFFSTMDGRSAGDCQFREYRLALACTGEYAQFHGGTVGQVMSAFNTSMNRVNGVFERDAGLTMVMVENNDTLIFLDGSTDPYTNGSGGTMLGQNQTTCDDYIGTSNYDIGHVFSTGGGGVASLRSPCNSNRKARGVTGRNTPVGDPFDIDYVAHEMGHQYGGNHTQNNSCNRSYASYEPGSASTIMGYAGICNPNVQPNSDDYFHAINVGEMAAFVTNTSTGGSCDVILSTINNAPTANAGADYSVPRSTAFALTGTATDSDGNPLTFCWEQYNNDVSTQPPQSNNTQGPNFRSVNPKSSSTREFPDKGKPNTWEVLAEVDRMFDFRLTVRDYNLAEGYGCTEEDDMIVTVLGEAEPFAITSPNGSESFVAGTSVFVSWNTSGTNMAPFNVSAVDILLSDDDGETYSYTLLSGTANDGNEYVALPNINSSQARIKVRAVGHIIFDISDESFNIDFGNCPNDHLVFNSLPITTGNYDANISITASVSLAANANVMMKSNELFLNQDFEVPLGAEFEGIIGICP